MLFAIDPGTTKSACVVVDQETLAIQAAVIQPNEDLRGWLCGELMVGDTAAIEMVASYGMPVGREVFETCLWAGRFFEILSGYGTEPRLITRVEVKQHLCHRTSKITDAVIRQVLIDRYGGSKPVAIGTKKQPGPLYGLKADMWAALALAVTSIETEPTLGHN